MNIIMSIISIFFPLRYYKNDWKTKTKERPPLNWKKINFTWYSLYYDVFEYDRKLFNPWATKLCGFKVYGNVYLETRFRLIYEY
jgi:hypothetical protein